MLQEVRDFVTRLVEHRGYGFDWWCPISRTLEQAGGACLRRITGHTGGVRSVRFLVMVSVSCLGLGIAQCVCGILYLGSACWGHWRGTLLVWSVSFSGDGKRIVSGSDDRTVRVWDAVSGECVLGPLTGTLLR